MAEAKDFTKKKWQGFQLEQAEKNYRAKIIKVYGTMQIFGMSDPVPLDDIFVEVEILDKPTAHQRYDIEELLRRSADPEKLHSTQRVGGLALVRDNCHLFILGKPGAGKTTFLKRVAYNAAEKNVDRLPIFISLKEWSDSQLELLPFIAKQFDICDFPEAMPFVDKLLKAAPSIVLFDGLDEVNQTDGQRDKQLLAMRDFFKKYDQAQCLITCRIAANDFTFEGFKYIEVADFSDAQIKQFVANWFSQAKNLGEKFLQEFEEDENQNLRELASSPLLLTMLCLLYQETLEFPQRRAEIYEKAMDALLRRWDVSRRIKRDEIYRHLTLGHKENMFAQVAAITFDANEYFMTKRVLENHLKDYLVKVPPHNPNIDGEISLKAIVAQHGIFTERAENIYSFSHLTFQEYFAAKYIVGNATDGTLARLLPHCAEPRWREVFLLTSSMLQDASKFLTSLRRMIDDFIRQDEVIVTFLAWATKRRNASMAKGREAQDVYLCIGLSHVFNHDLRYEFVFTNINLNLRLDLDLNAALDFACSRNYIFPLELDLHSVLDSARQLGLTELETELKNLSIVPKKMSSDDVWQSFATQLRAIMIKHRDIGHPLELTDEQAAHLHHYFMATRLLKDCLALATMPPEKKDEILDSLFLPPQPFAQ